MDRFDIENGEFVLSRDQPKLTFEESSYTLPELLDSHLLPVVAQYDSVKQPLPFHEFNFDLSQPLLLYKKRHIQKVAAHSLHIEDEKYTEVGESLLIPEDYKGWFAVLQRITGNVQADDSVSHFKSVEEIANSNTDRFLIGGTKKINGLQVLERTDADLKHEQRHFHPGDILTREKIYYGETRKRTRLFRKPKYITEKFLMCRDETDREVLLPFEQTGIFYQISHKAGKPNRHVMQMSDIVARKLTPRIIKLVFGRFPVTPCSFTGLMKAESSRIETSIIAATLINKKNILMEIPVSSAIHFRVAVMNNELRKNVCYRNAMSLCAERAITYMRNIKVCYNFTLDEGPDEDFFDENSLNLTSLQTSQSPRDLLNYLNNNNIVTNTNKPEDGQDSVALKEQRRGNSVDIPEEVTVRPGRSMSTGRMSFCLGNSYLTVPMFQSGLLSTRDSGNNNTSRDMIYTTRRGSKLSFNGIFFEEAEDESDSNEISATDEEAFIPPPLSCTTISSYVNTILPPTNGTSTEPSDYISASGARRPSTQPPETAPPPIPRSSSTSGVSSGSLSSVSDETVGQRESSDSFEYAVPKIQDPNTILSDLSEAARVSNGSFQDEQEKPRLRRPSTFTFSEGCLGPDGKEEKRNYQTLVEVDKQTIEDSSPIYENIQKLMELVAKLENQEREYPEVPDGVETTDELDNATDKVLNGQQSLDNSHNSEKQDESPNDSRVETVVADNRAETDEECCNENETRQHDDSGNNSVAVSKELNSENSEDSISKTPNDGDANEPKTQNINDTKVEPKVTRKGLAQLDNNISYFSYDENSPERENAELSEDMITNKDSICDMAQASSLETFLDEDIISAKQLSSLEVNEQMLPPNVSCDESIEVVENRTDNGQGDVDKGKSVAMWKSAIERVKMTHATTRSKIRQLEKPLHSLDVDEIAKELSTIGIKEGTIEHIKTLGVDGEKLSEIVEGEVPLRDCLIGVNLVEQQKISMYLRGWRPN